jgi:hypothetical protein
MGARRASVYALHRIERAMPIQTRACVVLLTLYLVGLLAACAASLDPAQDAATRAVFDQVKRRDFASVEARLSPRLRTAVTDARLQVQAALIPDQPPQAVKLVSFTTAGVQGGRQTSVAREYFYPDRLLVVSTTISEQAGRPPQIQAFNIQVASRAALAVGRFSLTGKSTTQYFLLGLAVLIPLLLICALGVLARDNKAKFKWLWTAFILIGFTQLSVNWTTGAILFQPLSIVLFGASIVRGPLDVSPWMVSISLPLGALVYLARAWFTPVVDEVE